MKTAGNPNDHESTLTTTKIKQQIVQRSSDYTVRLSQASISSFWITRGIFTIPRHYQSTALSAWRINLIQLPHDINRSMLRPSLGEPPAPIHGIPGISSPSAFRKCDQFGLVCGVNVTNCQPLENHHGVDQVYQVICPREGSFPLILADL
jgi:hypothetical protein